MRRLVWLVGCCALFLIETATTRAQQVDLAFGVNNPIGPSASSANSSHTPVSISGGAYPVLSGDVLFKHSYGVNGDVTWRGGQMLYGGLAPVRPILFDFNGIWAPQLQKKLGFDVMGGIGAEDLRFYQPYFSCSFTCTNYTTSKHFLGHVGADIRLYVHGGFFVRPEANWYFVRNNQEFSSNYFGRYGVSIGYTFFGRE